MATTIRMSSRWPPTHGAESHPVKVSPAIMAPIQGALLAFISQRRRGRLRSRTTPRVWYWPMMAARSTQASRRRASTAQCSLSSFSCSAFGAPSLQLLGT
jgi:hypothetical protein